MARTLELDTITEPGNSGTANITLSTDTTTTMPKVDINSGAIDATTLGAATPSSVAATTISASGNATVGGTLGVTGLSTLASVDINGGAVDGTTVGSSSASSVAATTLSASGNTTLSGTANNVGTVTAGTYNATIGSSATFPTGFCIKTHFYEDTTGTTGYVVTGTTRTAMTETLPVSVTSGNTYEITFSGAFTMAVPSSTSQTIGAVAMYGSDLVSSSTDIGDTFGGSSVAKTGIYGLGRNGLSSYTGTSSWGDRLHLVYSFVAGSTTTEYFTIAGRNSISSNTITLWASPAGLWEGQSGYQWVVREYQGNCRTSNYGG